MAPKEVFWDLWKQGQLNSFDCKWEPSKIIYDNLKIFSQNVHKNTLIINTILKTHFHFDIILIQEPSWSIICSIPSSTCSEGEVLVGTPHHPNWLSFARPINIHLSSFQFSLCRTFHFALKYLKDTEVNINNLLIMTGDFNVRDRSWDSSFPHYSFISDDLFIIADSFNLDLFLSSNPVPTRYSDIVSESDSVIDLIFLCSGSSELNNHLIHPNWHLTSDHVPLTVTISITEEFIQTSKLSLLKKSNEEEVFVKEVISIINSLDTLNLLNQESLEQVVCLLVSRINQAWNANTRKVNIMKHSKK